VPRNPVVHFWDKQSNRSGARARKEPPRQGEEISLNMRTQRVFFA
jgi:hypothetical protein